jgi:hypothetical protein
MDESAWVKKMQKKVEEELTRRELEMIAYWKGEIEKILAKKHESQGALRLEMQGVLQRMQNRIRALKQAPGG